MNWHIFSPEQHEQPSTGAGPPGQVRRGRGDAPTGAGAQAEGAGRRAPVDAEQHGQPSIGAAQPGQVRRGRGDAPR